MNKYWRSIKFFVFVIALVNVGCSFQSIPASSDISWKQLQITPGPIKNLCSNIFSQDLDWGKLKNDFTYGLIEGLYPQKGSETEKLSHGTIWVDNNEELIFKWKFWYPEGNDKPVALRLFVLLDEQQLNDALPQPGAYNDIKLERGDDLSIELKIPPLDPGIHDLIAIGIPYPQSEPNAYGTIIVISRRVTLVVESSAHPFRKIAFTPLPAEGSLKHNDPLMALELTLKDDGIDIWNWPDPWLPATNDMSIQFYALAGHEDVTNLDAPPMDPLLESFFAILLFVDYQQVETSPNRTTIYGKVDNDTAYTRIPLEIPLLPVGKHQILVLRIDTPGVPMCILAGNPTGRILPNSVYGKLVGIDVQPLNK